MKKLLFAALLLPFLLASCGSSENKGSENVDSVNEASKIITYTNSLIDYLNSTGDWLRSNEDRISRMTAAMENNKVTNRVTLLVSNFTGDRYENFTDAPAVMSEDEKEFFNKNMQEYRSTFQAYHKNAEELLKYMKNEDYKDDKYAKGQQLANEMDKQHEFLVEAKSELYKRIDIVTEKAEAIILKDHPLRDPILTLKGELNGFEELTGIFYSYNEGEATSDQVEAAYQTLAGKVEKNKDLYADILGEYNQKNPYEFFYKRSEEALADYRKVLRNVKAGKKVTDREFDTFNSKYNNLINAYNRFN